ncbi:MAG: hypothetical protein WCR52_08235 [Bacteroidota bacterium]
MIRTLITLSATLFFFACQQTPAGTTAAKPAPPTITVPDTIFVEVDSTGKMRFGGKDISDTDVLKARLSDSLSTFRKLGGKVPAMWYHTHGDVLMGMRGALNDVFTEVKEAVK